jgi:hypothetical protein
LRNAGIFTEHLNLNRKGLISGIGIGTESVIGILSSCLLQEAIERISLFLLKLSNPLIPMNLPTVSAIRFDFLFNVISVSNSTLSSAELLYGFFRYTIKILVHH